LYQLRDGWFNTVSSEASHISLNLIVVTSNNLTIIANNDVQNTVKIIREGKKRGVILWALSATISIR